MTHGLLQKYVPYSGCQTLSHIAHACTGALHVRQQWPVCLSHSWSDSTRRSRSQPGRRRYPPLHEETERAERKRRRRALNRAGQTTRVAWYSSVFA